MGLLHITRLLSLGLVATTCAAFPCDLRRLFLDPSNSWNANTTISFPNDGITWVEATIRWSPYHAPTYAAAISPATEDDAVRAVGLARLCNIPFLATGGRHGYGSSMGLLQLGLALDLSKLNSISVDSEAATLTVGGGTRTGDIMGPVHEAGFELPVGSCSCPGLVGVSIGAGANHWQGVHGYVMDSILSVRLITADARLIEVSEDSHPDLFWAIRGAGHNFGVITSATYRLYPPTNNDEILVVDAEFLPRANTSYFEALGEISRNQPPNLSHFSITAFNQTIQSTVILGEFVFFGPREEGLELLAPILDIDPLFININVVSWSEMFDAALLGVDAENCRPGLVHTPICTVMREQNIPSLIRSFEYMHEFYERYPLGRLSVANYQHPGYGRAHEIPDDATAYPWRDSESIIPRLILLAYRYILFNFPLGDKITEAAANATGHAIRSELASTSGYDDLAVYVNSALGDETIEQIYGAHRLPRLAALKNTWDPENVFRFHHAIPTSYP
ncbi:hypothetical protein S40288_08036 [Stachybotrys chartarum IBT 40288]|nr:hypothetical protein S40288_08036 [Stachybotrys chartarum IBT 40288]